MEKEIEMEKDEYKRLIIEKIESIEKIDLLIYLEKLISNIIKARA